ncbi:Lipid carrier : UDP-N-acetylgalactosaminyltransferase [Acinetobacter lwoffii]|nr:Lipid carrier : UDP-N-acetylgalactosaminyltransferase [Acinetobacter lwoffii]
MRNAVDKDGNLLPDKFRITSFGQKIRSTSLDEMPQLNRTGFVGEFFI